MKWIYVVLLVGLVGAALSSSQLRGFLFSDNQTETTEEAPPAGAPSSRLDEASGISGMQGEVGR